MAAAPRNEGPECCASGEIWLGMPAPYAVSAITHHEHHEHVCLKGPERCETNYTNYRPLYVFGTAILL